MPSPSLSQAAVVALTAAATMQPEASKAGNRSSTQPQSLELHTALEHNQLSAEFRGNGRDSLRAILTNKTAAPLTIRVRAGQSVDCLRDDADATAAVHVLDNKVQFRHSDSMRESGRSVQAAAALLRLWNKTITDSAHSCDVSR